MTTNFITYWYICMHKPFFKHLRRSDIVNPIDQILYIANNVKDMENESHYILTLNHGLVLLNIHVH